MSTPEGLLEPQLLTPITPTPPLLCGNASGTADYFKTPFPQHREADAADQAFSDMMRELKGNNTEPSVASKEGIRPKNADNDVADLLFKLEMDE